MFFCYALCACSKPKVALFDPERKGSLVFMLQTAFWTVCSKFASTAVRNGITGEKLSFSANVWVNQQ